MVRINLEKIIRRDRAKGRLRESEWTTGERLNDLMWTIDLETAKLMRPSKTFDLNISLEEVRAKDADWENRFRTLEHMLNAWGAEWKDWLSKASSKKKSSKRAISTK